MRPAREVVALRLGFRTRLFLALAGVAAAALLIGATIVSAWLPRQTEQRIRQNLEAECRLLADTLARYAPAMPPDQLDAEADRFGRSLHARITFVAADGRVLGDSMVAARDLSSLENHAGRPEVVAATREGTGASRRYSQTLDTDMLYVATRCEHPRVATVRLSLPLTEVREQVAAVRRATFGALALALGAAAVLAAMSSSFGRRLRALAESAQGYARGDLSPRRAQYYGRDELGVVARALDDIVRDLATRVSDMARERSRTEAILASMAEGVVVVDGGGRVQVVNRTARSMLGLGDGPAAGHYLELVRHPGVAGQLTAALEGRQAGGVEIAPAGAPGSRLLARAVPITAQPGSGAVLVLHDITDLHHADRVRRDFVANVSHELRTPLTAIRGYVEALTDHETTAEERTRFLDVISRQVNRMERLVEDLLRLARLDARHEAAEMSPCALEPLIAGAVADLAQAVENRRQRVQVEVDPAVRTIRTDAAKLQDVLRNLVENAVNYSPEGRLVEIRARITDGRAVITVADQGPGIPESDLERIFERFYRVDKARSRESGGTGLGLSIVKHLVDLLGGRVWAANRPEGGAILTVSLPVR
ncbi:MAG: ATP-binding protein [Vicinamibacterales bacterium]